MKGGAILRGGVVAGIIGAIVLASFGRGLGVAIWPWNWVSTSQGWIGFIVAWTRTAIFLLPIGIAVGVSLALVAAVMFEYVTQRAGWLAGAAMGLALGTTGTAAIALLPWFAFWFSYTFMPVVPPLGRDDPAWVLLALVATSIVMGAVVGVCYGEPRHRGRTAQTLRWKQIRHAASDERRQIASRV
jgi:hypothetical protein